MAHGLMLVVGPSGVGKDSILDGTRTALIGNEHVLFPRRFITRPGNAGGENHIPISVEEFQTKLGKGEFCLSWQAHGLSYGIPDKVSDLSRTRTVIVNGSRSVLDEARGKFKNLIIVQVTANEQSLRARLRQRGREAEADIEKRIERNKAFALKGSDIVTIDNSGPLDQAISQLKYLALTIGTGRPHPEAHNAEPA
ncbi:phosphonate metabolism protein/1,5-bisphosphokinase (PRPP-forming) PhnN [Sneathiella limimaris]|uniref:phosphonate metabolism protein/1,5-bisphosphokinase (PRPP-forming) PhnN n=1 Tax=Sneathiella limimaris TaxID=1964213 RepID=UPI00146B73C4|nr:phosphonate metabolism protein/1,5-bisphosphokinase (PRPP-forming) PhnN [Sneathiella limimaris]